MERDQESEQNMKKEIERNKENEDMMKKEIETKKKEEDLMFGLQQSVRPISVKFSFEELKNPPEQYRNDSFFDYDAFWSTKHNFVLSDMVFTETSRNESRYMEWFKQAKPPIVSEEVNEEEEEEEEGVKKEDFSNVHQKNDYDIPQGSFSMSQQTPEIDKEEKNRKNSSTFETGESSSSSPSNQQQEVLRNPIRSAEAEEEEEKPEEEAEKLKEEQNLVNLGEKQSRLQECFSPKPASGNHYDIPQGSFSMSQQTPEIDNKERNSKNSSTFETGESLSNQQQELLSDQIRSAEAEEGKKTKEEGMGKLREDKGNNGLISNIGACPMNGAAEIKPPKSNELLAWEAKKNERDADVAWKEYHDNSLNYLMNEACHRISEKKHEREDSTKLMSPEKAQERGIEGEESDKQPSITTILPTQVNQLRQKYAKTRQHTLNVKLVTKKVVIKGDTTIVECLVGDDTGAVKFIARGDQLVEMMKIKEPGTNLVLEDVEIKTDKAGSITLFGGTARESNDTVMFTVKVDNNLSLSNY